MSMLEEPEVDIEADAPAEEPGSGWAQLAAEYERVGEDLDTHLTLDVNADSRPVLCARYKWIDPSRTERLAKDAGRQLPGSTQALYVAAHTLALCCDEVGFRHPVTEELVSHPAGAVRFDARLAAALGLTFEPPDDRVLKTVLHAFRRNGWAVIQQSRIVEAWLADPTSEVNEAFLGE